MTAVRLALKAPPMPGGRASDGGRRCGAPKGGLDSEPGGPPSDGWPPSWPWWWCGCCSGGSCKADAAVEWGDRGGSGKGLAG